MLLPLLAALALASPPSPTGPPDSVPPGVVAIRGGAFCGTGFVWDAAAGLLLTALHVVEQMPEGGVEVVTGEGAVIPALVADRDPLLDLALLRVPGPLAAPALPLGLAAPAAGSRVALAACPVERCRSTPGRVLSPERGFAGARYLSLWAEAPPGSSGAPVLGPGGAVIGIVDLTLAKEPGVALAIPIGAAAARFPRAPLVALRVVLRPGEGAGRREPREAQ